MKERPVWPAALAVGLLALGLRLILISRVQMQFDEWLGGWHANPALRWSGSLLVLGGEFWSNVRDYVASGQTVAWSALVEALQLFTGTSLVAVRLIAAGGGAVGAAAVFAIARRLFPGRPAAAFAAAFSAAFSVPGVVFGQFADVYAAALLASSLQLAAYFFVARPRGDYRGWVVFALAAFVSALFMYTQLWLTAGIFLCGLYEGLGAKSRRRPPTALLPGALLYGALCAVHLRLLLRIIPWSESFRWYMDSYYPLFLRGGGGGGMAHLPLYLLVRLYDLFNYQLALVFDPRVYLPLRWNWVSVPFLLVLAAGIACRFGGLWSRRKRVVSDQLSVISGGQAIDRGRDRLITDRWSPITASPVPRLLLSTLLACFAANLLFLVPFGGVRQLFFLSPLFALFYGWLVEGILGRRPGMTGAARLLVFLLCLLPALPFALSLPGLYRDRVSRLDLDAIGAALERCRPDGLVASEQNLQILEMALARSSRFGEVRWPSFPRPSDSLDADFAASFPVFSFSWGGREWRVHGVREGYFPAGDRFLWVDMHISRGSRYEGEAMRRFYPDPERTIPPGYTLTTLRETPGNAPRALHQSIYWPPNSFYLYLAEKRSPALPNGRK